MSEKIKVLIVDDQAMVRDGIKLILTLNEDIFVFGVCENGRDCIDTLNKVSNEIDIILMDIRMPFMDGIEATKEVKRLYPKIKVLILTTFNDDESIFEALKYGAHGYILKDAGSDELVFAIKSVYLGGTYLHKMVADKVIQRINSVSPQRISNCELTSREIEIAKIVAQGLSNREIALKLYITEGTVKNHVSNILAKLGLNQRTQLVIYVKENKL